MGTIKNNLLTKGFSGRIGDEIVFRQVGKRTLFAKRPRKRETITPDQQAHQLVFKDAVYHAKASLLDPVMREEYQKVAIENGLRSAYNVGVYDYLVLPEIASVHAFSYKGVPGNSIFIAAVKDFKIVSMVVSIMLPDTSLLESGDALYEQGGWRYEATQPNDTISGSKVVVSAKDRLGREATFEQVLL